MGIGIRRQFQPRVQTENKPFVPLKNMAFFFVHCSRLIMCIFNSLETAHVRCSQTLIALHPRSKIINSLLYGTIKIIAGIKRKIKCDLRKRPRARLFDVIQAWNIEIRPHFDAVRLIPRVWTPRKPPLWHVFECRCSTVALVPSPTSSSRTLVLPLSPYSLSLPFSLYPPPSTSPCKVRSYFSFGRFNTLLFMCPGN